MKVWNMKQDIERYLALTFSKDEDSMKQLQFRYGFEKLNEKWKPFEVEIIKERKLKMGDCPHLGACEKVFSKKAIEKLKDFFIKDNIEILPLTCNVGEFYVVNIINVIDCLDIEKSEDGFFGFDKYVFKSELIKNQDIFTIPNEPGTSIFVSDRFKATVLNSGLEGFEFLDVCECE